MKKSFIVAGLILALATSLSWGRSKLEPPELSRYLRWGPLRARPGLQVSNFGYDDNIFADNDNKVGDTTATISPQLEGLVLFGSRAFLEFKERLEYTAYLKNTDQNFLNQKGSARFTFPVKVERFGIFTDMALNRAKVRPLDREDIRPEEQEDRIGFGVIFELGWRTELELLQTYRNLEYEDPDENSNIAERLDRDESGQALHASYRLTGLTRVTLDLERWDIEFDNAGQLNGAPVDRDSHERSFLGGLEFGEGGILSGAFRLGWSEIDADEPVLPDLEEIIGEVTLVYRLNSATRLRLEAWRRPGFAVSGNNTYYLDTSYGLGAVRFLNPVFGLEGAFRLGNLEFPESASGTVREDDVVFYEAGVRLRLAELSLERRIEYSIRIGRYERDSNVDSANRSLTTVSIGAVVGF